MPSGVCWVVYLALPFDLTFTQEAPLASHVMKHPELARTFEAVAEQGHDGFYKGRIAQCMSTPSLSSDPWLTR